MHRAFIQVVVPLAQLVPFAGTSLGAQPATGPVYESYRRAFALVERALEAHGGAPAIRGLRGIDYRYQGVTYDRDRSLHASGAFDAAPPSRPVALRAAVDLAGARHLTEFGGAAAGEGRAVARAVQRGLEVLRYAAPAPGVPRTFTRDSVSAGAAAAFPFPHQLMPALVLRQAIVRSLTLRHLGRRSAGGVDEELVSLSHADGSLLAIGIDRATGLVSTVETIGEIGLFGDGDHVWRFREYEAAGGVQVPRAFQHRINGLLQEDMRLVAVAVNPAWTDTSFAPPADYTRRETVAVAARAPTLVDAGGGVFFVEGPGGLRSMFVDTGEGIVAVEAPQGARAAEQAIALVRQAVPGKPITHVVLTHHHLDHVAGVRAYVELGAVVVAPAGMEDYLRRVVGGTRTFGTLGQPARPVRPLTIELVADRRRLGPIDLLHVTGAHAASMLVAYVPSRRLLFRGDPFPDDDAGAAARIVERHALDVRIIASAHGSDATMDQLRAARPPAGPARP